jgi:NarL family two-component system response regulator LiaR
MKSTPPESAPIRLLIVDDHAIIRAGLQALLQVVPDMEVVGEAINGREAVDLAEKLAPDVILMDLVMPEMDGIQAIRKILSNQPQARILVLTTFSGEDKVFPAIKAGAMGYQLKDSSPQELVEAIREVNRGQASLHPLIARKVLDEVLNPPDLSPTRAPLTQRELEVLRLIAEGLENREIAERLVLSDATVRTHVSNILGKLHLASRTQAALYALREGLASLDDAGGR